MKTYLFSTALVASLLLFGELAREAFSQQAAPQPQVPTSSPVVAAIDIGKIFKGHNRLKQMQEQMKKDAEASRNDLMKEKTRIDGLVDQLKALKPGTPDYKRLETDVVSAQAQLQTRGKLTEKEFTEREARNYFTVYSEINDEVKNFATYYKINLVLRYNSDPPDVNDPQSVLRDINKPIVYLQPNLDITDTILNSINGRSGQPAANTATPQSPGIQRPTR